MTKTAKQILERVYNKGFNDRCQREKYADIDNQFVFALSVDQALKELEAIMQTLVIDYENPLLAGHLSIDRKIERNLLRAEQSQALHTALNGKGDRSL